MTDWSFNMTGCLKVIFNDPKLEPIQAKLAHAKRLDANDGLTLLNSNDLIGIGRLADAVRRQRHGNKAYFIYNQHLNYTNVCQNRCQFCAFARDEGEKGSYTMTIDTVKQTLLDRIDEPIQELHIVGGINPELPFQYYIDLLQTIAEIRPEAVVKAFTAVEIDHLATLVGLDVRTLLNELKAAGLAMLPGGGAEVLSARIHDRLYHRKINGIRWLEIQKIAHECGLKTNATLLYGHIETPEERVAHLLQLRQLQDQTGGFSAFIPLAFHSAHTNLAALPETVAFDDLKTIATARLLLDNIDHIKAYWVMIGESLAQVALSFGADDLDGTIIEEKITHMAGATSAKGLSRQKMVKMIVAAGFVPVERNSFYEPVKQASYDTN